MSAEAIAFKAPVKKTPEQLQAIKSALSAMVNPENLVDWHVVKPMETHWRGDEDKEALVIVSDLRDSRAEIRLEDCYSKNAAPWLSSQGVASYVAPIAPAPTDAQLRGMLVAILGQAKCPTDVHVTTVFAKVFELLSVMGWTIRYTNLGMATDYASLDVRMTDDEHDLIMNLSFGAIKAEPVAMSLSFPFYTTMGFWNSNVDNHGRSARVIGLVGGHWHELASFNSWAGGADESYTIGVLPDEVIETIVPLIAEDSAMTAALMRELAAGLKANTPGLEFTYVNHSANLGGGRASVTGRSNVNGVKHQYTINFKTGV